MPGIQPSSLPLATSLYDLTLLCQLLCELCYLDLLLKLHGAILPLMEVKDHLARFLRLHEGAQGFPERQGHDLILVHHLPAAASRVSFVIFPK